jgi:hypothetical protein
MPEVPEQMQDNIARLELDANQSPKQQQRLPQAPLSQSTQVHPPQQLSQNFANHSYNEVKHQQQLHNYGAVSSSFQQENSQGFTQQPGASTFPRRQSSLLPQEQGSYVGSASVSSQPQSVQKQEPNHDYHQFASVTDVPNFGPFPRLPNRPPNVPPSSDEQEAILENARPMVLNSNDPEMQLAWAQDALTYVDICAGLAFRPTQVKQMLWAREDETKRKPEDMPRELEPPLPQTTAVERQLQTDAMNIVTFLADQGHPRAEYIRGQWLEYGRFGVPVDKKEAFRCYTRSFDKGYARAAYRMGMQYESTKDPVNALIQYKRGAELGDAASNYVSTKVYCIV